MPVLPKPVQDLLSQVGISHDSVHTLKFGGIVGKVALVALGGFAAVIAAARYTTGPIQIICVIAILLTTILIIRWIFNYAEKHPASATLEGTEMILWQHQQIMLAAKGVTPPKESPVIPNPAGAPPQLNPSQESDK